MVANDKLLCELEEQKQNLGILNNNFSLSDKFQFPFLRFRKYVEINLKIL